MKGVVVAVVLAAFLIGCCSTGLATPPIVPPVQYEQFCESQKVSGQGVIDVSTSITDKKIALQYFNVMSGNGDLELDSEHAYSQNADKLRRTIASVNDGKDSNLNLFESTKLTYAGEIPLTGAKLLNSKTFYGGIGAKVAESFVVNEMEKEETSYFTSTTPYNPPCTTPEKLIKALKDAGRDTEKVACLMGNNPAQLVGLEIKNTFNGTWGTEAAWHRIFYKDIKAREMFSGIFEAEKPIKFHDNPVPEKEHAPCEGIDC